MLTSFLYLLLTLAGVLAAAGILFLLLTRHVRTPPGDSQ